METDELIEAYETYKSKPVPLSTKTIRAVWQPLDKNMEDLITKYKTLRQQR